MDSVNQTLTSTQVSNVYVPLENNDYTNNELRIYSIFLNVLTIFGILFHTLVLFMLFSQQIKSRFYFKKLGRQHNSVIINKQSITTTTTTTTSTKNNNNNKSKFSFKNYVTFAFVFHQIVIDLLRLVYALFYSNSLLIDSKKYVHTVSKTNEIITLNASQTSIYMQTVYEKYCSQMALFYSILTMVTIINILTILISETCRFYDLKLSSSDTSSLSCILFGVALIWISSLIIISSLMLVGIADSAAPTYKCNLNESESPTRSLVINIVWFLLVTFVVIIACSYSVSLYKELTSLNYHHRLSLFAPNIFTISQKPDSKFLSRHVRIVDETAKRLNIFVFLIGVFCFTFLPNFIMTLLKNIIDTKQITLKPFNMISSIINLINPTLNSVVLLVLCIKSNDLILLKELIFDDIDDDDDYDDSDTCSHNKESNGVKRLKAIFIFLLCQTPFIKFLFDKKSVKKNNENYTNNQNDEEDAENQNDLKSNFNVDNHHDLLEENEEQKQEITDCNNLCRVLRGEDLSQTDSYNKSNKNIQMMNSNKNYYSSMNNINEFYSKIGNRLGNNIS